MLETNEDNLRTGTDKVVARLMSFAYIACYVCYLKTNMPLSISDWKQSRPDMSHRLATIVRIGF